MRQHTRRVMRVMTKDRISASSSGVIRIQVLMIDWLRVGRPTFGSIGKMKGKRPYDGRRRAERIHV